MDIFGQLAIAGLVLAGMALAFWTLQRTGALRLKVGNFHPRGERNLHLLERLQLTPQHSVCLVRFGDRTLLIGTAPYSCTLMEEQ